MASEVSLIRHNLAFTIFEHSMELVKQTITVADVIELLHYSYSASLTSFSELSNLA